MTELSRGGAVTWLQNPRSLEDRNSLAKLLFQADCKDPLLPFARSTRLELSKHTLYLFNIYIYVYIYSRVGHIVYSSCLYSYWNLGGCGRKNGAVAY